MREEDTQTAGICENKYVKSSVSEKKEPRKFFYE